MTKKKAGRGRPAGQAVPGSGDHEMDQKFRRDGFSTLADVAGATGISRRMLYKRIQDGRLQEGRDYVKGWVGRNGPVYVRAAVVARLKDEQDRAARLRRARAEVERLKAGT